MQALLTCGGLALLVVGLSARAFLGHQTSSRLAMSFTLLWGVIAGLHFWSFFNDYVTGLLAGGMEGWAVGLSLWLSILLTSAPGMMLTRRWFRRVEVRLPPYVEAVLNPVAMLPLALLPGLIALTIAVTPMRVMFKEPNAPVKVTRVLAAFPLRSYLALGSWTTGVNQSAYAFRLPRQAVHLTR